MPPQESLTIRAETDMFLLCSGTGNRPRTQEGDMARIKKEDHARILHLVDVERRAVREIAAEFGCTPATIYSLLTKLRRGAAGAPQEESETQPPLALEDGVLPDAAAPVVAAAMAAAPQPEADPAPVAVAAPKTERKVVAFERAASAPVREETARPAATTVGAKLAKPGMGLMMRTADGEETMTPFRSLDDLLSAIKPMLRASARSPEPVWFSLQPVDLATIDVDAA
jgi:transposase-like protein